MTDVDIASNSHWQEILDTLQLSKSVAEIDTHDIEGKEMVSLKMWEAFYYTYARWKGFSPRIDDTKSRKSDGEIYIRRWVCNKEGFRKEKFLNMPDRKKRPKEITRCGCQAALRILRLQKTNLWRCQEFVPFHNHDLVIPSQMQFTRANREVPEVVAAQVISMNRCGIKTSSVVAHIALQSGGYDNLPFQLRDVYNKVASLRKQENISSDAEGTLGFLDGLSSMDPEFYVEYKIDDENQLAFLFWADGMSRRDYMLFGEAIAFDTTYRTNKYNKPLTVVVGVNHHFETCVFGCAVLLDETEDAYIWFLRVFLDCMGNKKPKVLLTDNDERMGFAIRHLLRDSTHRLCAWHLGNNAAKNIKIPDFNKGFFDLIYNYYTVEEFEEKWAALLAQFGLEENSWCRTKYNTRGQWAETFLRGVFYGGMRTTQRCESMNNVLKRFLLANYSLREFVSQITHAIGTMRHNEAAKDFKSMHTIPHIPAGKTDFLQTYYKQAAAIFTRNIYYKVKEQIEEEEPYSISHREDQGDSYLFSLARFQYGEIRHRVLYNKEKNELNCSCLLFESDGIPCKHIWCVMKSLDIRVIPESLILTRWRKDVKTSSSTQVGEHSSEHQKMTQLSRFGALNAYSNSMNFFASHSEATFQMAKMELEKLNTIFRASYEEGQNSQNSQPTTTYRDNPNIIQDPVRVRTKGIASTNSRKGTNDGVQGGRQCTLCGGRDHNKRTCMRRTGV
ncbi:protein FAR1-RELATED SEQUENCE 5-like [Cannabis sativa]|uniref:protein FAR1-RELATED SEQUENCE 5-like n=1 Tax=Cannabis sativa TaxID=3483 RepID=UPI0029C9F698|nr:protein FAR1-RELATED SEQUENCE 5-like [Cannabis sativa]